MANLMERVSESPELQQRVTKTLFQLGWVGESGCIRQNQLTVSEDGTVFSEHPVEGCPLDIAIRDVPAEYQPISDKSSVKVKVHPDVHEGHFAGEVIGVDCYAQNTESERAKERQEAYNPDRERHSELRKNLNKHI